MTGVMITAAKRVCGVSTREVANPWTNWKSEETERKKDMIKIAVTRIKERMQRMHAKRRLKQRREDAEREEELMRCRTEVRNARKDI